MSNRNIAIGHRVVLRTTTRRNLTLPENPTNEVGLVVDSSETDSEFNTVCVLWSDGSDGRRRLSNTYELRYSDLINLSLQTCPEIAGVEARIVSAQMGSPFVVEQVNQVVYQIVEDLN